MQTVAVGALVTEATGKSAWTGIVAAAAFIPIGIFAPLMSRFAERPHEPEKTTLRSQIVAGFRGAMAEPGCRLAITLIGITALLISPFIALIPAVAINLLHEGARGTSALVTAQG